MKNNLYKIKQLKNQLINGEITIDYALESLKELSLNFNKNQDVEKIVYVEELNVLIDKSNLITDKLKKINNDFLDLILLSDIDLLRNENKLCKIIFSLRSLNA